MSRPGERPAVRINQLGYLPARSHPFALAGDLYRGLVRDALAFFYLQRSAIAIDGQSYVTGYGTDFTRHQRTRHSDQTNNAW